ncbi:MAG TPA: outer membrane beta-barrel protein [Chthoniobacterales bacterium]
MMKTTLLAAASAAVSLTTVFAGTPTYEPSKEVVAPPPPPPVYGTGFYIGLQAGINAYTDFNDTSFSILDNDIRISADQDIGFVGGLKFGYVFGTGTVRPALEADLYYNGIKQGFNAFVNGESTDVSASSDLNSGAFLANFLLRFAFERFQPYIGAGLGGWVAQADNIEVTIAGETFDLESSGSDSGFAWQLIAGADYYWTEKFSTFLEYKFLNYEEADFSGDNIAQQIVVLGVRWHF